MSIFILFIKIVTLEHWAILYIVLSQIINNWKANVMIDDDIRTLDESRKWVLQTFDTLKTAQTELYDLMQQEYQLINEHKLACDNTRDSTLDENMRTNSYKDAVNLRNQMNELLNAWFVKYENTSF